MSHAASLCQRPYGALCKISVSRMSPLCWNGTTADGRARRIDYGFGANVPVAAENILHAIFQLKLALLQRCLLELLRCR